MGDPDIPFDPIAVWPPGDSPAARSPYADLLWSLEYAASDLVSATELSSSGLWAALMLGQDALDAAVLALDRHATGAGRLSDVGMTEVVRLMLGIQHMMAAAVQTLGGPDE